MGLVILDDMQNMHLMTILLCVGATYVSSCSVNYAGEIFVHSLPSAGMYEVQRNFDALLLIADYRRREARLHLPRNEMYRPTMHLSNVSI